ncbi:ceramidase [Catenovulum sp. 2E275]|uniref:ceramidase n=1 Tax=Catenovulum sp. 2E275 TaxID=2980497 RepID=UPI0021D1A3DD|nr:ceramidase [Catenovulum sp. 2E275]MCU4675109.1 ceramidase [Catenovulum sp. 2E275]
MDYYCERIDFSFWSEPVNAMTNLGFILAGLLAFYLLAQANIKVKHNHPHINKTPLHLNLLAGFMIIIGIGSFLFHTLANFWSMLADIIPIYIYQVIFLWSYLRYALKFSKMTSIGVFVVFIITVIATKVIPFNINGSEMYLPSILILLVFSAITKIKTGRFDKPLLAASGCFCISLTMRTIDQQICPSFPLGTHFGWHLFNSAVLFLTWYSLYKAEFYQTNNQS